MRVLITRPEADARRTAEALAGEGIDSLIWPLTEIRPADGPIAPDPAAEAILFTSANAVRIFAAGCARRDLPALCVGRKTADAAREAGFGDVRSAEGDAAALVDLTIRQGFRTLYHPRGRDVAGDVEGALAKAGSRVHSQIVYAAEEVETIPEDVDNAMKSGESLLLALWSARNGAIAARHLAAHPDWRVSRLSAVAISERAAAPIRALGLARIALAAEPSGAAMLAAIRAESVAMRH